MGEIWVHDGEQWRTAIPQRSNGVAHDPVFKVFRRSGSQWVEIWSKPVHPPNPPEVVMVEHHPSAPDKVLIHVATARSQPSKIIKAMVKVGVGKQPTTPTANDGTYYATKIRLQNGQMQNWSDWWGHLSEIPPGTYGERDFPRSGIAPLPPNTEIWVAAWVQDEYFQWSPASRAMIRSRPAERTSGGSSGGGSAPKPVKPQPKRQPDLVRNATWHRTWEASGYVAQASQGALYQGRTPYYPSAGIYRSMAGFPDLTGHLHGATIHSIEVYVHAEHWHYQEGIVSIGYHGNTSRPEKFSQTASQQVSKRLKRGQGAWITLPTSAHAGFRDGRHRGVTFYRNSTNPDYYGYFDPARLKIRVKYSK